MAEKIWYLKSCDLFERLTPAHLERLEARSQMRTFPKKGLVYLPRDEADAVFLLATGRIKLTSLTGEGKQAILTFIEPGEIFGELAALETGRREEFAEAMETSTVVRLAADEFVRLLEELPHLSLGVTKLLGLRVRRIERRLKHLLFQSTRERLIHLLLELVERYGQVVPAGIELSLKLSHQDLASIIGSTRESVTVTLGELQAENQIALRRRHIILTQAARLAASVEAEPPHPPPRRPASPTRDRLL